MLEAILLFGLSLGLPGVQGKPVQACRGVDAALRVTPGSIRRGAKPAFTLVLRNRSNTSIRLLDVRGGRRPDLAINYFEVIVERKGGLLKDLPRAISDPGPIDAADFFVLPPGAAMEAPLATVVDLGTLPAGRYSAHVRITLDPFNAQTPRCRSGRTPFTVTR